MKQGWTQTDFQLKLTSIHNEGKEILEGWGTDGHRKGQIVPNNWSEKKTLCNCHDFRANWIFLCISIFFVCLVEILVYISSEVQFLWCSFVSFRIIYLLVNNVDSAESMLILTPKLDLTRYKIVTETGWCKPDLVFQSLWKATIADILLYTLIVAFIRC